MSHGFRMVSLLTLVLINVTNQAQTFVKEKIIDAVAIAPVYNASIQYIDTGCTSGCLSNATGE